MTDDIYELQQEIGYLKTQYQACRACDMSTAKDLDKFQDRINAIASKQESQNKRIEWLEDHVSKLVNFASSFEDIPKYSEIPDGL